MWHFNSNIVCKTLNHSKTIEIQRMKVERDLTLERTEICQLMGEWLSKEKVEKNKRGMSLHTWSRVKNWRLTKNRKGRN